jgi:tetratricopeptide (TPR) repeat protein
MMKGSGLFLVCVSGLILHGQPEIANCNGNAPRLATQDGPRTPASLEPGPDNCSPEIHPHSHPGVVSARVLGHKPPKAAIKEYDRGARAWEKDRMEDALQHFTEAIRLDPDFLKAHSAIGLAYSKMGRPDLALGIFERLLNIEPSSSLFYGAKASALVMLDRPAEAELAARRALQLDPRSVESNYMLGTAMLMQGKRDTEAAASLSVAARHYPRARALLETLPPELVRNLGNHAN